jgi:hypothetical protein
MLARNCALELHLWSVVRLLIKAYRLMILQRFIYVTDLQEKRPKFWDNIDSKLKWIRQTANGDSNKVTRYVSCRIPSIYYTQLWPALVPSAICSLKTARSTDQVARANRWMQKPAHSSAMSMTISEKSQPSARRRVDRSVDNVSCQYQLFPVLSSGCEVWGRCTMIGQPRLDLRE